MSLILPIECKETFIILWDNDAVNIPEVLILNTTLLQKYFSIAGHPTQNLPYFPNLW